MPTSRLIRRLVEHVARARPTILGVVRLLVVKEEERSLRPSARLAADCQSGAAVCADAEVRNQPTARPMVWTQARSCCEA